MKTSLFRIIAAVISVVYIALFCLLPFASLGIYGSMTGGGLLNSKPVLIIVIGLGIAGALCALFADKIIGAVVSFVAAIAPMVLYFVVSGSINSQISGYFSGTPEVGGMISQLAGLLSSIPGIGSFVPSLNMGLGIYVCLILGIAAGVLILCEDMVSAGGRKPTAHSAGYSAGGDDEW